MKIKPDSVKYVHETNTVVFDASNGSCYEFTDEAIELLAKVLRDKKPVYEA